MRKNILFILILIVVTSCSSHKTVSWQTIFDSYSKYRTTKQINLDTQIDADSNYIEFENKNSLIIFKPAKLVSAARTWLSEDSLCLQKQKDIQLLIEKVENKTTGFYCVEPMKTPEVYKRFDLPNYNRYKKNFIDPYGFKLVVDSTSKVRLEELKKWMISKMCLSGFCMVYDKRTNQFVKTIDYEIVDFNDGHGGESLVFDDKTMFYSVKVYSDVRWPDFECMSVEEIKAFWNSHIINEKTK